MARHAERIRKLGLGVVVAAMGITALLLVRNMVAGTPNDRTVALGFFGCAGTTLVLLRALRRWRPVPRWSEKRRFLVLGWAGAVWAETLFWAAEKVCGASGVAANPNLLVDLLVTMPWYMAMVWMLWKVHRRCGLSWREAALLGGLYELGADGVVGSVLKGQLTFGHLAILPLAYPLLVGVYSVIVVPPVAATPVGGSYPRPVGLRWLAWGLLPLVPLIPYAAIALALFRK